MWVWFAISSPSDFNQGTIEFLSLYSSFLSLVFWTAILDFFGGFRWQLVPRLPFPVPRSPLPVPRFSNILYLFCFFFSTASTRNWQNRINVHTSRVQRNVKTNYRIDAWPQSSFVTMEKGSPGVSNKIGPLAYDGRDPFNQNFRKFRSKTQWIGSVQPEKFRKNWSTFWGGPLIPVVLQEVQGCPARNCDFCNFCDSSKSCERPPGKKKLRC